MQQQQEQQQTSGSGTDSIFRRRQKERGVQCDILVPNSGGQEPEKQLKMGRVDASSDGDSAEEVKEKRTTSSDRGRLILQWGLKGFLYFSFFVYVATLAIMPTEFGRKWVLIWSLTLKTSIWGTSGVIILVFSGPIFLVVFGGILYLHFFPKTVRREIKKKEARASLSAHPVFVSGPLGVVTAAELLWILGLLIITLWILGCYIFVDFRAIAKDYPQETASFLSIKRIKRVGLRLGWIGGFALGLLFIPVSRGSILLRLLDIPFEHAAKYHVWLGHFTMTVFSLHGLSYIGCWWYEGRLLHIFSWKAYGVAILPGAISLGAGLLMWATSFQYTRIRAFELFYYTHHLYIVFIICMVLHVGDFIIGIAFSGIFLFAFDRFLRFWQSRKGVGVLSATLLPCGAMEIVLPKPSNLVYNELSFIFLNIPSIDRLQWHPFSVSSSPNDSPDDMKFLIKPLGSWTRKLETMVSKAAVGKCPLGIKAAVEGPYGHETSYFLDYEFLLLVAGGIGVSPFVAVIRDLLHRYKTNEPGLPQDVTLIWAVKSHKELYILDSLHPNSIYPDYASRLKLNIKAYVTRESEEDLEAVDNDVGITHIDTKYDIGAERKPISHIVGSGHVLWVGAALAASVLGYVVFTGLVGFFYLNPVDHDTYKVVPWWKREFIVILGVIVGIVIFGGSVILLWDLLGTRARKVVGQELGGRGPAEPLLNGSHEEADSDSPLLVQRLIQRSNTVYGLRPDLEDIFDSCAKRFSGSNVGVLVCGPEGMQSSVAEQCRAFNTLLHHRHQTAFSYHSVSFDL